jgi:hypothetical protein
MFLVPVTTSELFAQKKFSTSQDLYIAVEDFARSFEEKFTEYRKHVQELTKKGGAMTDRDQQENFWAGTPPARNRPPPEEDKNAEECFRVSTRPMQLLNCVFNHYVPQLNKLVNMINQVNDDSREKKEEQKVNKSIDNI